jgi:signal transduction histidine kinase
MQEHDVDTSNFLFRTAAWIWLGYLVLLLATELYLSHMPLFSVSRFYLVNGSMALLFLFCALWPGLQTKLKEFYTPLMLVLIAGLPIVVNGLLIGPLPPSPLSSIEGVTLRLLPVLLIGLIITAWQYSFLFVALYALLTTVLDIGLLALMPPGNPNAVNTVIFVAMVRLVSFLVVGYFISRLIQRLQAQQQQLEETNKRLVHYAGTLEQLTLSRERNRLARELHDTLAHSLSALSVQLETTRAYWDVEPETARGLLEQSLATTRTGLNETRRALRALRASPLDDLGLLLALHQLAQSTAERGRLTLQLSLPEYLSPLSSDVEQCIYRVAQEALENVVRHANARTLSLTLTAPPDDLALTIVDDGAGFDPLRVGQNGRLGLAGMRERAALVAATLAVDSRPHGGTCIKLTFKEAHHANKSIDLR